MSYTQASLCYTTAITNAANRLIALQSPTDYGWDWIVTGESSHSVNASATNLYGVTAIGLLDAYQATKNSSYLTAAENTANFMMENTSAGGFWYGHDGYHWGYSFDYSFLMQLSAVTTNPSYKNYALAAWAWQKANIARYADGNQSMLWNHYVNHWVGTGYYGMAAWQASDWGLQALEMGNTLWAQHMAAVLDANMSNIAIPNSPQYLSNYTNDDVNLGMGETLNFLATIGGYSTDVNTLRTLLETNQLSDGSWDFNSTAPPGDAQTTAYCVMGLYAAGARTYALKGANWLLSQQQPNGGVLETNPTDEYSEIDSEGVAAMTTEASALPSLNVTSETAYTPAWNTTFSVNVAVQNVANLYGYDFKLYWNSTLLDCIGFKTPLPNTWSTHNFAAENQTNQALGMYWLAVTASSGATAFTGTTTLATLTFKITYDPIYPENVTCLLHLADTYLSDQSASAIAHTTVDGQYWLYSTKPAITVAGAFGAPLKTYTSAFGVPFNVTAYKIETINVNVTISNVVNLYNYTFTLWYNSSLLYASGVNVGTFLQQSELQQPHVFNCSINNIAGLITLGVASVNSVPPVNGSGLLATITFKTVPIVWPNPGENTTLQLLSAVLKTNQGVTIPCRLINGFYAYKPIPGDLNSDGTVDISDLRIVAAAYGTTPGEKGWNPIADLNRDGIVDIYDLVIVAEHLGWNSPTGP